MPEVPLPAPRAEMPEPMWLNTEEAARLLGFSKAALEKWRFHRKPGPPFVRKEGRVRYVLSDLRTWADSQAREVSQ